MKWALLWPADSLPAKTTMPPAIDYPLVNFSMIPY